MKTILLIEDNIDILENIAEYLELEGYHILFANDGQSGIEMAREYLPDLIICDVRMPKMNGYEVLHLLLDTAKTHEIPFIFSTSLSEKMEKADALKLGADDYIVKPFELNLLLKKIEPLMKEGSLRHR